MNWAAVCSPKGHTLARYAGLRAWKKYIGVMIPSRPDSTNATAQKFRIFRYANHSLRHNAQCFKRS